MNPAASGLRLAVEGDGIPLLPAVRTRARLRSWGKGARGIHETADRDEGNFSAVSSLSEELTLTVFWGSLQYLLCITSSVGHVAQLAVWK